MRDDISKEDERSSPGPWKDLVWTLSHEEARPGTVVHEVGQVRLRKVVRTEMKQFSVPVRREELVVEEVPEKGGDGAPVQDGKGVFEPSTLVIPLHEERVEFIRRPEVWQEVTVLKSTDEESRPVRATVRREVVRVDGSGEVLQEGPMGGTDAPGDAVRKV